MSDIPNSQELIEMESAEPQNSFRIGVVVDLFPNSTAKITFDGEDAASEKQYAYLSSYTPTVGDRVLLASTSSTYVVLGKVKYNEGPNTGGGSTTSNFTDINVSNSATVKTLNATGDVDFDLSLNVDGNATLRGELAHRGVRLGFYNAAPITKQTAYKPGASADITVVRTRLIELIDKLGNLGLIISSN